METKVRDLGSLDRISPVLSQTTSIGDDALAVFGGCVEIGQDIVCVLRKLRSRQREKELLQLCVHRKVHLQTAFKAEEDTLGSEVYV
jgi:hypothetical protein